MGVTHHLVGSSEAAKLLGVTRQRLAQLYESHDDFPEPEVELAAGRVWRTEAIEEWRDRHAVRRPGRPVERLSAGLFAAMSDGVKGVLKSAEALAMSLDHNLIAGAHLLLAMTQPNPGIADTLGGVGVTFERLRPRVEPAYVGVRERDGKFPTTPLAKAAIDGAVRAAFLLGDDQIRVEHLLIGLCETRDRTLAGILEELGTNPDAVRDAVTASLNERDA